MAFRFYRSYIHSLDLLFPPQCAGCAEPGSHWCSECQANLRSLRDPQCPCCGLPQKQNQRCDICREKMPSYEQARSFAYYEGRMRKALLSAKYRRDLALGLVFAQYLEQLLNEQSWKIDGIVPIPLAKRRLLQRGYNQVELFARPLALMLSVKYQPSLLKRKLETSSQIGLSQEARWSNVKDAFVAKPDLVEGKRLLVLDDVMTTGATLSAASDALMRAGADAVFALTVARAVPDDDIKRSAEEAK